MRFRLILLFLLLAATSAIGQSARPAPWRAALRDAPALAAAGVELLALCSDRGVDGLFGHFPEGRIRLFMRRPEVPDGLYGPSQARVFLEQWSREIGEAELALILAHPSEDSRSAGFLLEWRSRESGEKADLICRLELTEDGWCLREVQAP